MSKLPRIMGIGSYKESHVHIRLQNPLDAVQKAGLAETGVWYRGMDSDPHQMIEAALHSDLIILQGASTPFHLKLVRAAKKCGVKVAIDHDDHPFIVSPFNPSYCTWGLKECDAVLPDGTVKYRWRDGQPRSLTEHDDGIFDIKRNRESRRTWLTAIKESDALIVTTERLKDVFRSFKTWRMKGHPIGIIPNYVDFGRWRQFTEVRKSPHVRILWQGGFSHVMDLYMIRDAMREIALTHPEVMFVFFGNADPDAISTIPPKQVEVLDWVNTYEDYCYRAMTIGADIGIAPLTGGVFDECKSTLKFIQYGALGIPSVLSNCPPYSDLIQMPAGQDKHWPAFLAHTHEDWVHMLGLLIKNERARLRMGENANRFVRGHFDLHNSAHAIMDVYERILSNDIPGSLPERGNVAGAESDLVVAPH